MFIGFCPGQSVCSWFIYFLWFTSPFPFSFSSSCFMFIGLPGFDPCLCSCDFVFALPQLLLLYTDSDFCLLPNKSLFSFPLPCALPHTPPSQSVTPQLYSVYWKNKRICFAVPILLEGTVLWFLKIRPETHVPSRVQQ